MAKRLFLALMVLSGTAAAQHAVMAEDLANVHKSPSAPYASTAMPAFQAGILALKSERPSEAIGFLTRELATHPQNAKAWYYRGVCHASTGANELALADLERALELEPGDANALLRRSEVNMALEAYDAAATDLATVLRMHAAGPIAEHALMSAGELHMRKSEHLQAIAVYDRFVAIAPNDARSWFNRGIAHAQAEHHSAAISDLGRAIDLDGWLHRAYASRAIELIHVDRRSEGCRDLAKAKELGDDSVDELLVIYCE